MTEAAPVPDLPHLRHRLPPLATLFLLAPWVGEYLVGNVPGPMLWALPILALMYGGGAILLREIAVRLGGGWPVMLLLGAAYGVIEAGLVDQSLFAPGFTGASGAVTPVLALGISAGNTVAFVLGHAIWSISLPVAFAGFLFPGAARAPWLGRIGLGVVLLIYLAGSRIIFADIVETEGFIASPAQRGGAALVAVGLVGLAAVLARRPLSGRALPPLRPVLTGLAGFVLSGLMVAAPETWAGLAWKLAVIAGWAALALTWGRHPGWTARHAIAWAGGILMTYAWLGPVLTLLVHGGGAALYFWNAAFALCAAGLVTLAWCRAAP